MLHSAATIFVELGSKQRDVDGRDHMDLGSEPRALAVAAGMISVFVARRTPDGTPGRRTVPEIRHGRLRDGHPRPAPGEVLRLGFEGRTRSQPTRRGGKD